MHFYVGGWYTYPELRYLESGGRKHEEKSAMDAFKVSTIAMCVCIRAPYIAGSHAYRELRLIESGGKKNEESHNGCIQSWYTCDVNPCWRKEKECRTGVR